MTVTQPVYVVQANCSAVDAAEVTSHADRQSHRGQPRVPQWRVGNIGPWWAVWNDSSLGGRWRRRWRTIRGFYYGITASVRTVFVQLVTAVRVVHREYHRALNLGNRHSCVFYSASP